MNTPLRNSDHGPLSEDAKAVAYAFMPTIASSVTFHFRSHRPTQRTQAALEELVDKGLATAEPFNRFGSMIYKPTSDFSYLAAWAWNRTISGADRGFMLWEPVKAADEQLQTAGAPT